MTLLQSFPWSEERLEHFLNAALYGHMPWSPSDADEELPVMSPVSALTRDLQRGQRQLAEASESEDLSDPDVPLSPEKIATPVRVSDSWTFGELSSLRLMSSEFDRSPQKLEVADGIMPFASAASSCSAKSTAREAADRTAQFTAASSSCSAKSSAREAADRTAQFTAASSSCSAKSSAREAADRTAQFTAASSSCSAKSSAMPPKKRKNMEETATTENNVEKKDADERRRDRLLLQSSPFGRCNIHGCQMRPHLIRTGKDKGSLFLYCSRWFHFAKPTHSRCWNRKPFDMKSFGKLPKPLQQEFASLDAAFARSLH